jgi:hypothetical protein
MLGSHPRRVAGPLGPGYNRIGIGGPTASPSLGPSSLGSPPASASSSSSASTSNPISSAISAVLADALGAAQVAGGITLLGLGLLLVLSQTSAGAAAGRGAVGGARRAARLIPGVGVLA